MFNIPRDPERQARWVQLLQRVDWRKNPPKDYHLCQVCEVSDIRPISSNFVLYFLFHSWLYFKCAIESFSTEVPQLSIGWVTISRQAGQSTLDLLQLGYL